jgi:protein tyrosine phosphatase (PTP) superfamily phosphohydrolase (DUF442 family)
MLDNLPPLDLPRDAARADVKTAAASPTENDPAPSNLPAPVETAGTDTATAGAPSLPSDVSVAPGVKRFAAVEPKLAGGGLPSRDGLDWLSEKGYKTLVDLRDPGDVQSSFLADVSRRGLRYISLPISLNTLDRDHVSRFEFEISLADARPLYFFDTDGNRAGMLWYVHRMTDGKDSYDAEEAMRQAGEVGLVAEGFRKAARTYLESLKKAAGPTPAPAAAPGEPAQPPAVGGSASLPPRPAGPNRSAGEGASAPRPGASPLLPDQSTIPAKPETIALPDAGVLDLAQAPAPAPAAPRHDLPVAAAGDPDAWRPYLAMVFAAFGVPLAYCGRSLIQYRGMVRASLPKPVRRLRSLPGASGE